ncbi:sensor histidine kinase [Streptomyces sp. NBC_01304]|uniref:sensor histidine kinase n=1 Tax=Streptomyces sp. NBC_01304 TaxID=2903818 RepID=UPI002E0F5171|nr:sensor histidine kinase [Streptomyces sp. NBC_01304]
MTQGTPEAPEASKTGRPRGWRAARPGPRSAYAFLPWLLLGMGALSNVVRGETPNPWVGGAGLLIFNSLYVSVVFSAFDPYRRNGWWTYVALSGMAVVTAGLGIGYGGAWLALFPLLSLACGAVLRGRRLGGTVLVLACTAALTAALRDHDAWGAIASGYGTLLSGIVTAAILALSENVVELRETRQELARVAVEKERLRFSRDLHDLLGHTLSVIVVKSEAARRLAPRDLDGALAQVTDIESIGRQALTEIREAVTGYREGSLATELDRARDALAAAGIESVVRQSGPPLAPQAAALLGWVVRESVTNAVRHSGATQCEIEVVGTPGRVRLTVTDDGRGVGSAPPGNGLTGLTERLVAAGGTLQSGAAPQRGFRVTAQLPIDVVDLDMSGAGRDPAPVTGDAPAEDPR